MGSLAVVPKSGPAVKSDETPEGIEKRNEHKANSFAAIQWGSEHGHHFPAPVKVCQAKDKPVNSGEAPEAKGNEPNVTLGNLKSCSNECAHCDKGEEQVKKAGVSEMGEVKPAGRAILNGGGARSGAGIVVAESGFRNGLLRIFPVGFGEKTKNRAGFLFVRSVIPPDQSVFSDFRTDGEFLQAAEIQGAVFFSAEFTEPPCRSLWSGL